MLLDLKITGGRLRTMDPRRPVAHTLGCWRGRIVGLDEEVADLPSARVVDLRGATALPGFVDAHTHLAWTGLAERLENLSGCDRVDDLLDRVAALAVATTGWIELTGYDHRRLDRPLTAADLDRAAPGRPVYVQDLSGHACVVSEVVLARLPESVLAPGAPGVLRDAAGRPTGGLTEGAQLAARRLLLPRSVAELSAAVALAARRCLAEGVTMCAEAGIGAGLVGQSPVELLAYQQAVEQGRLPVRVQVMAAAQVLRPVRAHPADGLEHAADLGVRTGLGDDRLALGALKIFLDGGMMARTAALSEPYRTVGGTGQLQDDPQALTALVARGHAAGWQLAIHAIGDRAIDLALDAIQTAQTRLPRPDARHRIEHCGLVRPDQLDRLAAAGVVPVLQPSFLWAYGDDYAQIMGAPRADWLYRGRSLLDRGITVAGSSDRPVAVGAPLRAIQFMVERTSSGGRTIGPDEAMSVHEALFAYTMGGARACRRERVLGSLVPGKLADLVVLGDDPHRVPPGRIAGIEVLSTVVDGVFVHDPAGLAG